MKKLIRSLATLLSPHCFSTLLYQHSYLKKLNSGIIRRGIINNLEGGGIVLKHRPRKLGDAGSIPADGEIFSCILIYLRIIPPPSKLIVILS